MPESGPDITAEQVLQACRDRRVELVEALDQGFQWSGERRAGEATEFPLGEAPSPCRGPALVLLLKSADAALLIAVCAEGDLLPDWCAAPSSEQSSQLEQMGGHLAAALAVEGFEPSDCQAMWVLDLAEAMGRAGLTSQSRIGRIDVEGGATPGLLLAAGPLASPDRLADAPAGASDPPAAAPTPDAESRAGAPQSPSPSSPKVPPEAEFEQLPEYARSLLKIKLPVMVTLASARQPVSRILELGPGVIIQFDKSCDETLTLEVGDQKVAVGEAVKVGDKFGLRITSMVPPEERFHPVGGRSGSGRDPQ